MNLQMFYFSNILNKFVYGACSSSTSLMYLSNFQVTTTSLVLRAQGIELVLCSLDCPFLCLCGWSTDINQLEMERFLLHYEGRFVFAMECAQGWAKKVCFFIIFIAHFIFFSFYNDSFALEPVPTENHSNPWSSSMCKC